MEKRNFENYKTKREAFLAYESLKTNCKTPLWMRGDEDKLHFASVVDFTDWLWLPDKEDGRYNVAECLEKYLGRKYL